LLKLFATFAATSATAVFISSSSGVVTGGGPNVITGLDVVGPGVVGPGVVGPGVFGVFGSNRYPPPKAEEDDESNISTTTIIII
jgi:hypothetical protein